MYVSQHRQKGAVLAVSLMFLLMATMVAIATMDGSVLQERMATNYQNKNRAFQASESAVETHVTEINNGGSIGIFATAQSEKLTDDPDWPTVEYDAGSNHITSDVELRYIGVGLAEGSSINSAASSTNISAHIYEYHAESSISNTGSKITLVQGTKYTP